MLAICVRICIGLSISSGDDLLHLSKRAVLTNCVGPVAFSADGTRIASPGSREGIVVWDAKTGKKMAVIETSDDIHSLKFSHDNQLLAHGRYNAVEVWDVRSGKLIQSFAVPTPRDGPTPASVTDVGFSKDNKKIICTAIYRAGHAGQIVVGDLRTGTILKKVTFDAELFALFVFHPDANHVAVNHDGKVSWWGMKDATFSETVQLKDEGGTAIGLAVHPNGELFVHGNIIGADRKPRGTKIGGAVQSLVGLQEGGKTIVTYDPSSHELHIWDYKSQKRRQTIALSEDEDAVTMSPDGRQLVTARQRNLTVWDIIKKGK